MDTRIGGGDFVPGAAGLPQTVTGTDEMLQRIYIRLCAKKGGFPLDPALGSELHLLRRSGGDLGARALKYAQAALSCYPAVEVHSVRAQRQGDNLALRFSIVVERQGHELEVVV